MMRPTIPIAALMVVTAVDYASTMSSVQSVNATLEILVSATIIWVKKFCQCQKPNYNYSLGFFFEHLPLFRGGTETFRFHFCFCFLYLPHWAGNKSHCTSSFVSVSFLFHFCFISVSFLFCFCFCFNKKLKLK